MDFRKDKETISSSCTAYCVATPVNPEDCRGDRADRYVLAFIWVACHTMDVAWTVEIGDEFDALQGEVQLEILALSRLLQAFGPRLGRLASIP